MLLSNTIEILNDHFGDAGAIKLLAECGFDAYDMSFITMDTCPEHPLNGENYIEYLKNLRKVADEAGIVCNQAHAPFHSSYGEKEKDDMRYRQIIRSIEGAAILGAKIIVVHPKQHLKYWESAEELREINLEFYKSLIPYCEKYNIKVAVENMWQYKDGGIVDSTCSRAAEFCDYVDMLDSKWIVACVDIGHVVLTGETLTNMFHSLGNRVQCLHVHDNDLIHDNHCLPFVMNVDFKEMVQALKDIEYKGDFTFEAASFCTKMPKELLPSALRFMHDTGRVLMKQIND